MAHDDDAASAITREAAGKTNPDISVAVFSKRVRQVFLRHDKSRNVRQIAQRSSRRVPKGQPIDTANGANPDVSARVCEQTKYLTG